MIATEFQFHWETLRDSVEHVSALFLQRVKEANFFFSFNSHQSLSESFMRLISLVLLLPNEQMRKKPSDGELQYDPQSACIGIMCDVGLGGVPTVPVVLNR